MDISSLLQASDAFFANVDAPPVNNLARSILDRSSSPAETAAQIAGHANSTRVLVHCEVVPVLDAFLSYKRRYGSENERLLYREMTREALVRRLIRNRPLAFYGWKDITVLRDQSRPNGREWERVGTGNEGRIRLEEYLSYDEMQVCIYNVALLPHQSIIQCDSPFANPMYDSVLFFNCFDVAAFCSN